MELGLRYRRYGIKDADWEIRKAICKRDYDLVEGLIRNDPEYFQKNKIIKLIKLTIEGRNCGMTKLLLKLGPQPSNRESVNLLWLCMIHKAYKTAEEIIERGMDVNSRGNSGSTALHCAVKYGNQKLTRILMDKGADVNAISDAGNSVIHEAAILGRSNIIKSLIDKGADIFTVDRLNRNILHFYCYYGASEKVEVINLCLKLRIDINSRDISQQTPLHMAISVGKRKIPEILIQKGADINAKVEDGETPLMYAARFSRTHMVKLLLKHNASINEVDDDGATALHKAALSGNHTMVRALLRAGGKVYVETNDQIMPFFHHCPPRIENAKLIIREIIKLEISGGRMSRTDIGMIESEPESENYYNQCKRELEEMQQLLLVGKYSMLDLFRKPNHTLMKTMRNLILLDNFRRTNLRTNFPIWKEELLAKYRIGTNLIGKWDENTAILTKIMGHRLPLLAIERIAYYITE